ncbi:G protein pathway suppressor 2 isoform X2 [Bacillus rossius redtenbacheri]
MTLEETREQIAQLEMKVLRLNDEKHQLFLQLKKVLNEDDRRKQLVKESNDLIMHAYPAVAIGGHPSIFLQQNIPMAGRAPLYKVAPPHGAQHSLLPPGTLKRPRSPSPPPPAYHQGYGYKPGAMPGYPPQKIEDSRRGHEYVRAVLWNKNTQYAGSQPFYAPQVQTSTTVNYVPSGTQAVYTYTAPQYAQPSAVPSHSRDDVTKQPHAVYVSQSHGQHAYLTPLHQPLEQHAPSKPPSVFPPPQEAADKFYSSIRPATHVAIHGGAIPIQQPPQGGKTGGITSGYPIRAQPVAPPPPPSHAATSNTYQAIPSSSHNAYVSQAQVSGGPRLMYSQAVPHSAPGVQARCYAVQQREM